MVCEYLMIFLNLIDFINFDQGSDGSHKFICMILYYLKVLFCYGYYYYFIIIIIISIYQDKSARDFGIRGNFIQTSDGETGYFIFIVVVSQVGGKSALSGEFYVDSSSSFIGINGCRLLKVDSENIGIKSRKSQETYIHIMEFRRHQFIPYSTILSINTTSTTTLLNLYFLLSSSRRPNKSLSY